MNKDKKCETIQALFADYLDGTLKAKPKLMSMVDAHLNHCGVCRRAWEGYRMAVQSLHQLGSQGVEVPRELYPRLCNAIATRLHAPPQLTFWQRLSGIFARRPALRWAMAGMTIAVILIGCLSIFVTMQSTHRTAIHQAPPTTPAPMLAKRAEPSVTKKNVMKHTQVTELSEMPQVTHKVSKQLEPSPVAVRQKQPQPLMIAKAPVVRKMEEPVGAYDASAAKQRAPASGIRPPAMTIARRTVAPRSPTLAEGEIAPSQRVRITRAGGITEAPMAEMTGGMPGLPEREKTHAVPVGPSGPVGMAGVSQRSLTESQGPTAPVGLAALPPRESKRTSEVAVAKPASPPARPKAPSAGELLASAVTEKRARVGEETTSAQPLREARKERSSISVSESTVRQRVLVKQPKPPTEAEKLPADLTEVARSRMKLIKSKIARTREVGLESRELISPPIDIEVRQNAPAVVNQQNLWFMTLRPRQNLERVQVLMYAPKYVDVRTAYDVATAARMRVTRARRMTPPSMPIKVWEGSLIANRPQRLPIPVNPLAPGAQEVRLILQSGRQTLGDWVLMYPVARTEGQFKGGLGGQRLSVNAVNWRLVDLCRYLANKTGLLIMLPANLADARLTLRMNNVPYRAILNALAHQLKLECHIVNGTTIIAKLGQPRPARLTPTRHSK